MDINYATVIALAVNLVLIFLIITAIFKGIQNLKQFINRNKEMDKKLDIIINKLENKCND
ncbi:carboxymuconolactone decarboxylase [Clostridium tepidum]|jgi:predicted PurR-regulated permease PerM|uniref:Carboxymuconolactone decarboxylase n=1 Tax=Clostridium tepidum TaxID=1962263 RepID=A0A1S9I1N8_9CLOT|nr:carboxymuconolactone decarboxylase [Clostridium tepidum]MCR1935160.1 carboxymuconolactone decarboxylase [Clostridium tepidum]MDU6877252.1 carboxymuconolactone decarboxylase [Clostridium botulinum]OOO63115.1 carboxymuconolactone decarboxylase [Clostridium tepidum]OOO64243.1 carboxymuconolactone decarboxylase [Clostridium tepidum]